MRQHDQRLEAFDEPARRRTTSSIQTIGGILGEQQEESAPALWKFIDVNNHKALVSNKLLDQHRVDKGVGGAKIENWWGWRRYCG